MDGIDLQSHSVFDNPVSKPQHYLVIEIFQFSDNLRNPFYIWPKMSAKRILILNGPNLNLVGKRDPQNYGTESFEDYFVKLKSDFEQCELDYFQSNLEGELIDKIQTATQDVLVFNAGGYTHTSVALRDCIDAVDVPVIEVHISNIAAREEFRHTSMLSPVCVGCVFGFGLKGYAVAIEAALRIS